MKLLYTTTSVIRVARVSAGFSQDELADRIGRSRAFVSRIETGGSALLTPSVADRIAKALNLPPALVLSAARRSGPNSRDENVLRAAIRAAGFSFRSLAQEVGVDERYVSCIVRGRRVPNDQLAGKIADILGRPIGDLFDDRGGRAA